MKHATENTQNQRQVPVKLLCSLLAGLTLLFPALAQEPAADYGLAAFLEPIEHHPALQASAAALRTAEAQLTAANDPFSLSITAGYSGFSYADPPELPPLMPPEQAAGALAQLPDSGSMLSADLTLRPFPFGDIRDLVDQRSVELEFARLDRAELLTMLQVQAVEAALGVQLAEESLELAQQAELLAQQALEATRIRAERGAANQRELRDAEARALEAGKFARSAEAGLQLARLGLKSLTGSSATPAASTLSVARPSGAPLGVRRAELNIKLAETGARNAKRSVLPVAQAGYTWNLDSENSVGFELESRTLQPNLNFTRQTPGAQFPQDQLKGTFQIGVSASISPAISAAIAAADAQVAAAHAGLIAARRTADVELAMLENDLEEARQTLDLADLLARNAQLSLAEARTREELGLGIPLETQQAALEQLQAGLELQSARQQLLSATLAFNSLQGVPLLVSPAPEAL